MLHLFISTLDVSLDTQVGVCLQQAGGNGLPFLGGGEWLKGGGITLKSFATIVLQYVVENTTLEACAMAIIVSISIVYVHLIRKGDT